MIFRNLDEMLAVPTSHGCGLKKVLLANGESEAPITQIAVTELRMGTFVETHTHPSMEEFFLLLSGKLEVSINGCIRKLNEDCFIQIEAGCGHSLKALADCRLLTIGCAVDVKD